MKLLILVASLVTIQALEDGKIAEEWTKFQTEYGKSYKSPVEIRRRLSIFKENLEHIEAHNALFSKGETSYTKAVNQFGDWTPEEFLLYVNRNANFEPENDGETFEGRHVKIPESVDWRESEVVSPVKDQGSCSSSWAFSAVGAVESQLALEKGTAIELSAQQLIDCSIKQGNLGCNGGLVKKADEYMRKKGIVRDVDYPFTAENGECKADLYDTVTKIRRTMRIKKGKEDELEEALATIGPVAVSLDATAALQFYSGGVLNDTQCDSVNLNLAALAVGYGVQKNRQYYLIKNSWGTRWGESGYFKLPRNSGNKCGVATSATYPVLM